MEIKDPVLYSVVPLKAYKIGSNENEDPENEDLIPVRKLRPIRKQRPVQKRRPVYIRKRRPGKNQRYPELRDINNNDNNIEADWAYFSYGS